AEISRLRYWYFGIVVVVFLVVALGVGGLWRSASAQLKLARQKDDFISAVSHELRTPLTSIRMYTEMLEKDYVKDDAKRLEYYRSMRSESERLSRLIENVLDFSRIQRGRKQYDFKLGDINQCVHTVIEMMQPYAVKNGFIIHTRFGTIDHVTFDHDAVMQIVINLIDNAIKYARNAGDKTIIVSTSYQDSTIFIDVEDRGPGLPHAQRQKVFEEFYRLEAEDTRETNGAGLGLALVKKFAEAHQGFVEILSVKPTGSIFRIALPVQP
ncbi:MAG: HAMP domain-containing histidine kinase, partial [Planctomycetes bacterium]|nr:HAMP domain-containing histidine kinase [Planctomycetota bacterium]